MNYTTNYHLPQWVESDRVLMEDFNQMCADIDGGIAAAKNAADTAQNTANNAYAPENKPYVIGTYTGSKSPLTIELGFRPSFLLIAGGVETSNSGSHAKWMVATAGNTFSESVTLTDTGFSLSVPRYDTTSPHLVDGSRTYSYIAFR